MNKNIKYLTIKLPIKIFKGSIKTSNYMPQIDKLTFLSTVYWIVAFYFFLYLDVNVNYLYSFLARRKVKMKRRLWVLKKLQSNSAYTSIFSSNIGL